MSAWRAAAVLSLLSGPCACFVDGGTSSASSPAETGTTTGGSTSGGESTTQPDPGDPTTTSAGTQAETTGGATSGETTGEPAATTGDTCQLAGERCGDLTCCGCLACLDGVCTPNELACGPECRTCDSRGICNLAPIGAECPGGDGQEDCTKYLWGEQDGTCYAFASGSACNAVGVCVSAGCEAMGEPVVSCPECMYPEHGCEPGAPVAGFTIDEFCETNGQTQGCSSTCANAEIEYFYCNPMGACEPVEVDSCGNYQCDGDACGSSCANDSDCVAPAQCLNNQCV